MLSDDQGIITFPLKLLCYTILLAMVFGFVVQGLWNARVPVSEVNLEREVGSILMAIDSIQQGAPRNLLYSDASEGCKRVLEVEVPGNTAYLSLGSDPELGVKGNIVVYRVQGGGKRVEYLDVNICAAARDKAGVFMPSGNGLLLKSGRYRLTFELVYDPASGERWVIVY